MLALSALCMMYIVSRCFMLSRRCMIMFALASGCHSSVHVLGALLNTSGASSCRALGRFLARVLLQYTRELFMARMSGAPAPFRPDREVCEKAICIGAVDEALRTQSRRLTEAWLGRPLPVSRMLHAISQLGARGVRF